MAKYLLKDGYHRAIVKGKTVEFYVYDGETLKSEWDLWESFGLAPEDFGASKWSDVNRKDVESFIPVNTF